MWRRVLPVLALTLLLTGCMAQAEPVIVVSPVVRETALHQAQAQASPSPSPSPSPTPTVAPTPTALPTPTIEPSPTATPTAPPPTGKVVYLTFDDGPSKNTPDILGVLEEEGVVATFFCLGEKAEKYPEHIKAIADEGSLVANHTYSHKTDEIYKSAEALLADVNRCRDALQAILGEDYPLNVFRFPYGSTNRRCRDLRPAVYEAGYVFFDWNALNGDAESGGGKEPEDLLARFRETADDVDERGREMIVLMHDTNSKQNTVKMLKDAIEYLKTLGYEFRTLQGKPMAYTPDKDA